MGQPKLFSIIDKAVFEYNMIENGDRILIGASGGKDSTALAEYFAARLRRSGEHFSAAALHVDAGFSSSMPDSLRQLFERWKIPLEIVHADVIGRLKPGRKMNCWWCSTQRRSELNTYAIEHGFNKIALGHHLDDILETLLMNALNKGELSTMIPRLAYRRYPVTIIRPLCFADVDTIAEHGKKAGYAAAVCTCAYQDNSGRKTARNRLRALTNGSAAEKRRLFEALRNVKPEYLP
ncbi:MAG: tRNA 2-thiocytidine biosynthesis TtcA family protein [Bacteroides sp.]|nr:tRNA 2-thiocytidine biosynthesis TtcA family protein [Prevotella sp.]MCM1406890.1 tRNA 2-thiocytidine biosynthesis TtcA family protein [Treponema brennaborense]MCM1470041.1 tRNA 2-thiocytidine biosynthesis TtcA family protein [Bacteroides sp.]